MRFSHFPDMPFSQEVTFPCELTLRSTPNGLRIFREPIRELALLHSGDDTWTNRTLKADSQLPLEPSGRLFRIKAAVSIPEGAELTFNIRGVPVVLTPKTIRCGNNPASVADQIKTVELLVDRTSIEVFVNRGEISLTKFVLFKENGLSLKAKGGSIAIESLTVYPLHSAWE
jgi:levanase/fructan beta-fructosidase